MKRERKKKNSAQLFLAEKLNNNWTPQEISIPLVNLMSSLATALIFLQLQTPSSSIRSFFSSAFFSSAWINKETSCAELRWRWPFKCPLPVPRKAQELCALRVCVCVFACVCKHAIWFVSPFLHCLASSQFIFAHSLSLFLFLYHFISLHIFKPISVPFSLSSSLPP